MMSSRSRLCATLSLAALVVAGLAAAPASAAPFGPVRNTPHAPVETSVAGRYIVRTTSTPATTAHIRQLRAAGAVVRVRFDHAVHGFAGTFTAAQVRRLRADPSVTSIRPDVAMSVNRLQVNPTWGLDRIDQRALPRDHAFRYDTSGRGVTVFVVDTGIRYTNTDFGGRAVLGHDFVDPSIGGNDCDGHGTHVAGTIGGAKYGVAKKVKLVSLRVFDCNGNGYSSNVMSAFDWAIAHQPATGGSLVNFSGGGDADPDLDSSVEATIQDGIPVVIAAGNDHADACNQSPGRVPTAVTVAASDVNDQDAYFSNYGSCVDLFAPGVSITSDGNASNTATAVLSGTSMATPHVAGAIARYLQSHPTDTPAEVSTALLADATPGALTLSDPNPDLLLFSGNVAQTYAPTQVTTARRPVSTSAEP